MIALFYFLILRPQKKRQQAQQRTLNSLTPGTQVLLASGVFGNIVEIGEKQAVLEVSPGVQMTVLKAAIARVATDADLEPPLEETEFEESELDEVGDAEPIGTVPDDASSLTDRHDAVEPVATEPDGSTPARTDAAPTSEQSAFESPRLDQPAGDETFQAQEPQRLRDPNKE
ncbi:hypothetical protein GCM10009841_24060 [Microlunatus panaciterrae]